MTRKQRAATMECVAICAAAMLLAFVIPTLVSVRDGVVALCGALLGLGWLGWTGWFLYRMNRGGL